MTSREVTRTVLSIFYQPLIPTRRFLKAIGLWAIGFVVLFTAFVETTISEGTGNVTFFYALFVWLSFCK